MKAFVLTCALAAAEPTVAAASDLKLGDLSADDLKAVVIRLSRESCFGSCPAYTLTISGSGEVVFEGMSYVKTVGRKTGHLSEKAVRELLAAFQAADFLSIGDTLSAKKCSCAVWTDYPTVITELQVRQQTHSVERYAGCGCDADVLVALENKIDKIAGVSRWTGDVKGGPFGTTRVR